MNSCLYGNGTSFVESLFEDFGKHAFQTHANHKLIVPFIMYMIVVPPDCNLHMLSASPVEQKEHKDEEENSHGNKSVSHLVHTAYIVSAFLCLRPQSWFQLWIFRHRLIPPLLCQPPHFLTTTMKKLFLWIPDPVRSTSPPLWTVSTSLYSDDFTSEWINQTLKFFVHCLPASRNSVEDAYYEDADKNYPTTRINGPPKNSSESVSGARNLITQQYSEARTVCESHFITQCFVN